ncbi:hypothetical protein QBC44DRAFT_370765 [Cladorrhinum sp. PSN332]|nr:hypothetical protein QBC44DRAFT_370765 [Cladorrhinum sp. PSN332]
MTRLLHLLTPLVITTWLVSSLAVPPPHHLDDPLRIWPITSSGDLKRPSEILPDYPTRGPVRWMGKATPDGPTIIVSGKSLPDIKEIIEDQNPTANFTIDPEPDASHGRFTHTASSTGALADDDDIVCQDPSVDARKYKTRGKAIREGIRYLESKSTMCRLAPRECQRVSCSWNSGIYWCNEGDEEHARPCRDLAEFARKVYDKCKVKAAPLMLRWWVAGEYYHAKDDISVGIWKSEC